MERGVFVIDLHIRKLLRVLAHRRGQLGERLFAVEHDLHELDGRQQSVTSIGTVSYTHLDVYKIQL